VPPPPTSTTASNDPPAQNVQEALFANACSDTHNLSDPFAYPELAARTDRRALRRRILDLPHAAVRGGQRTGRDECQHQERRLLDALTRSRCQLSYCGVRGHIARVPQDHLATLGVAMRSISLRRGPR
jgi:hypothetical protein